VAKVIKNNDTAIQNGLLLMMIVKFFVFLPRRVVG